MPNLQVTVNVRWLLETVLCEPAARHLFEVNRAAIHSQRAPRQGPSGYEVEGLNLLADAAQIARSNQSQPQ